MVRRKSWRQQRDLANEGGDGAVSPARDATATSGGLEHGLGGDDAAAAARLSLPSERSHSLCLPVGQARSGCIGPLAQLRPRERGLMEPRKMKQRLLQPPCFHGRCHHHGR
ncbi:unnamed protein product [Urochloa humidicola]